MTSSLGLPQDSLELVAVQRSMAADVGAAGHPAGHAHVDMTPIRSVLAPIVAVIMLGQLVAAGPSPSAFVLREGKARRAVIHGSPGTDEEFVAPFKRWLYHGSKKLGRIEYVSVSPSSRFALFEFDGRLTLYDRRCECRLYVNKSYNAFPGPAIWDEESGSVRVPSTLPVEPHEWVVEIALPESDRKP